MDGSATIEGLIGSPGEAALSVATWATGHLPYGSMPEEVVEKLNENTAEHMGKLVALSHFYTMYEGEPRRFAVPAEDVIQGEFRGFELTEEGLHMPVGIRMNVDLVPGSSPGVHREDVVPLWSEEAKALRVPNFDYSRKGGTFWSRVIGNGSQKIKF